MKTYGELIMGVVLTLIGVIAARASAQSASAAMDRADALGSSGNLFTPDLALGAAGVAMMLSGIVLMTLWTGQRLRRRSEQAATAAIDGAFPDC